MFGDLLGTAFDIGAQIYNLKQQKRTQEETWKREDTAIQRQMEDLKKAGINPLMAGNLGGASSTNTTPPQIDTNPISKSLERQMNRQLLKQEKEKTESARLENVGKNFDNLIKEETWKQYQRYGLPAYSTIGKTAQDITRFGDITFQWLKDSLSQFHPFNINMPDINIPQFPTPNLPQLDTSFVKKMVGAIENGVNKINTDFGEFILTKNNGVEKWIIPSVFAPLFGPVGLAGLTTAQLLEKLRNFLK